MVQAQMTISEWLADPVRNYAQGVALYAAERYNNKNVLRMLQRKESKGNMDKLIYELGKCVPKPPSHHVLADNLITDVRVLDNEISTAVTSLALAFVSAAEEHRDRLMFHELPAELRPVLLEKNQCFSKMCLLKIELNELDPEKETEAYDIQVQIVELQKRRDLCWKKLDYWLEHRAVPASEAVNFADLTPEQRVKRQQLLFAAISKLKTRVAGYQLQLYTDLTLRGKTTVRRKLAKSQSNLLSKETELLELTNLIEGR